MIAKQAWWEANSEMRSVTVDDPFVFGDQFAVNYTMDVTLFGERSKSSEVGIYTLKNGKITEERFFYAADDM